MDNKVLVNFSKFPFCFRCTKVKKYDFTNYLSKSDEFFDNFKLIFEQLIPHVVSRTFDELNRDRNNHSHRIQNNTKEYDIVKEVIKNLCMEYRNFENESEFEMWFNQNINDYEIQFKDFEDFDYDKDNLYDKKDLYEVMSYKKQPYIYIRRKVISDKVKIIKLVGNRSVL